MHSVLDDVNDQEQSVQNCEHDTLVQPHDSNVFTSLFEDTHSTLLPSLSPAEFRKAVYAYGTNELISSYTPTTLGEQLDVMSAKLAMAIDLSDIAQVNALKLSLSRTVDTVLPIFPHPCYNFQ
ncbi:hypothetical protein DFQ30_006671 [Apophysomyces sp. BC1015]|nr:hypothetical protein DFQ30_006671 [Apophysomyces sp. BC1015]